MICGKIVGGLGNQLFQIFAILSYSIQHKTKAVFFYEHIATGRKTYWDSFFKNLIIFTTKFAPNNITNQEILDLPKYQEPGFEHKELPYFGNKSVYVLGYFQSYKYFENYRDQIYSLIKIREIKETVKNEYSRYFDNSTNSIVISMHFRLGDYKHKRYYHPIMKYEYYEESLKYIVDNQGSNGRMKVLYFCEQEDNEFVYDKRIIPLQRIYPEIEFIKADDVIDDWKQMVVMSLCDHFIMANSTFSWWGAYLSDSQSKIVCYPSKWFGEYYEHNYKCDDLMPESWIKISSSSTPWNEQLI